MTLKNYCYDIHHNLAIDYVNGKTLIGPCCQSGRIETTDNKITDQWNHIELLNLRQENLKDNLPEKFCKSCIDPEAAGLKSRRQNQIEFYQNWNSIGKKIRGLDLKLSILCNLKCLICGPDLSTAWADDSRKLGKEVTIFPQYIKNLQFDMSDKSILEDLELVHFHGGEPLVDDKHLQVLEYLDDCGVLKNCRVTYNTNSTHRVNDRVLEFWNKAKIVELFFSIDDIGNRFEYQRNPAKWKTVNENLIWFKENISNNHLFYITSVVSYLNIWYLAELVEWKKSNFDSNRLGDSIQLKFQSDVGSECRITYLPANVKTQLVERFENYPMLLELLDLYAEQENYYPVKFVEYVDKLDAIRNTSWVETFKEFNKILND